MALTGAERQRQYRKGLRKLETDRLLQVPTSLAGVYATSTGFFIDESDLDTEALGLSEDQARDEAEVNRAIVEYFSKA